MRANECQRATRIGPSASSWGLEAPLYHSLLVKAEVQELYSRDARYEELRLALDDWPLLGRMLDDEGVLGISRLDPVYL